MFGEIAKIFKNMNKISKKLMLYGMIPVGIIFLASLVLYITAGRQLEYYTAMQLFADLFTLGKEMLGVIMVPALLIEIVDTATGKQRAEAQAEDNDS